MTESPETRTLIVKGDLVSTHVQLIRAEAEALFDCGTNAHPSWSVLKLDLTGARMIDSVGLNLIVTLLKRIRKQNGKMQVLYSSPNVLRTFIFTRLEQHVELIKG